MAATIANVHRGKNHRGYTWKDFYPDHEPKKIESPTELMKKFMAITGGKRGKGNRPNIN